MQNQQQQRRRMFRVRMCNSMLQLGLERDVHVMTKNLRDLMSRHDDEMKRMRTELLVVRTRSRGMEAATLDDHATSKRRESIRQETSSSVGRLKLRHAQAQANLDTDMMDYKPRPISQPADSSGFNPAPANQSRPASQKSSKNPESRPGSHRSGTYPGSRPASQKSGRPGQRVQFMPQGMTRAVTIQTPQVPDRVAMVTE